MLQLLAYPKQESRATYARPSSTSIRRYWKIHTQHNTTETESVFLLLRRFPKEIRVYCNAYKQYTFLPSFQPSPFFSFSFYPARFDTNITPRNSRRTERFSVECIVQRRKKKKKKKNSFFSPPVYFYCCCCCTSMVYPCPLVITLTRTHTHTRGERSLPRITLNTYCSIKVFSNSVREIYLLCEILYCLFKVCVCFLDNKHRDRSLRFDSFDR